MELFELKRQEEEFGPVRTVLETLANVISVICVALLSAAGTRHLSFHLAARGTSQPAARIVRGMLATGTSGESSFLGETALHLAASQGTTEIVESLLGAGADFNAKDRFGRTPLHRAVWSDDILTIERLIHAGADVEARSEDGRTPLLEACSARDESTYAAIHFLLKAGADVNTADHERVTPLIASARVARADTVRLLLSYGARIEFRDASERTALETLTSLQTEDLGYGPSSERTTLSLPLIEARRDATLAILTKADTE